MPDSKLVEKLGFHIEGEVLTWPDGDQRYALATERAAWSLCLELSERANCKHEGIVITTEVSYCPACWRAFPIANPPLTEAEVKRAKELLAEKEKKA